MAQQFKIRKQSVGYTDQRARTLLEVLGTWAHARELWADYLLNVLFEGSMRVVKYFSYELSFLQRRFFLYFSD